MSSKKLDTRRSPMVAPLTRFGKKKAKAQLKAATAPAQFAPAPNFDPNVDPIFAWYLTVFAPGHPFNATLQQWGRNGHDTTLLAQQAAWETLRYGIFLALSGDAERLEVFTFEQPALDDAITMGAEYVTAVTKNIMSAITDEQPVGTPNVSLGGTISGIQDEKGDAGNGYSRN